MRLAGTEPVGPLGPGWPAAEEQLQAVEEELAAKIPVAAELARCVDELAQRIETTATPPTADLLALDAAEQALLQAQDTGAERVTGLSVHETGHSTPRTVLVPHPPLANIAAELDLGEIAWANATAALETRRDELVADKDAARRELEALAD